MNTRTQNAVKTAQVTVVSDVPKKTKKSIDIFAKKYYPIVTTTKKRLVRAVKSSGFFYALLILQKIKSLDIIYGNNSRNCPMYREVLGSVFLGSGSSFGFFYLKSIYTNSKKEA